MSPTDRSRMLYLLLVLPLTLSAQDSTNPESGVLDPTMVETAPTTTNPDTALFETPRAIPTYTW